jgi:hypothetical protein
LLAAPLAPSEDAFGHLLVDLVAGRPAIVIVDRDDAFVSASDARCHLAPSQAVLGNDLGLLAGGREARKTLGDQAPRGGERARLLRGSWDPNDGASDDGRRRHARNRARERGVERIRVRYRRRAAPWYDVLFASREEVPTLAAGTGWTASRLPGDGPGDVAVIDLE